MTSWLVVGAGAAGCVVAARLSENPANDVVVLEAGHDHGAAPVATDLGPFFDDPARIRDDATVIRRPGDAPTLYRQGLGLGGSSLINGSIVVDAPGGDVRHGHLLPLEEPWALGGIGAALLGAADDAAPLLLVRHDRARVTAADAYLRPVLDRPNLAVVPDSLVERLLRDGRHIVGAAANDGREFVADRVVCSAGAIHTPALLLRSGIDTPGIGEGLQDHPALAIALDLASGATDPAAPATTVSIERPGRQILAVNHLPGAPAMGVLMAGLTSVTSTGRVTLPDPDGPPLVELHQLDTTHDLDGLTTVAMEALDLLDHPAMWSAVTEAYVDDAGTPAAAIAGDRDAVRAWLPDHPSGFHHVSASCRMGVVTDEHGAVRGYDGLYLCDASVFPGVPVTNPYLSVIRLAERLTAGWRAAP